MLVHPKLKAKLIAKNDDITKLKTLELLTLPDVKRLADISNSSRYIYTLMPISLLPPTLLDTAKVVYIARDPRDVVVSFYHINRLHRALGYVADFKTFWNLFMNNFSEYLSK